MWDGNPNGPAMVDPGILRYWDLYSSGGGGSDIEADNDNTGDDKNKRAKENKDEASEESAKENNNENNSGVINTMNNYILGNPLLNALYQVSEIVNQFNPAVDATNLITANLYGTDYAGRPMSTNEATINAAFWGMPSLKLEASAAKLGRTSLKFVLKEYTSLSTKFGLKYESIAVRRGTKLSPYWQMKLNGYIGGKWNKIYEAGILNGSKVEVHYFYNSTHNIYVNPFIKSSGWQRQTRQAMSHNFFQY